jgi:hypothetical protein
MTAWTIMDAKLVFMFMKSTGRCRPGICRMPPGHRSANSAVAMIAGAQSIISLSLLSVGATQGEFSAQRVWEAGEEAEQKTAESSGTLSIIAVLKTTWRMGVTWKNMLCSLEDKKDGSERRMALGTEHTTIGGKGISRLIDWGRIIIAANQKLFSRETGPFAVVGLVARITD